MPIPGVESCGTIPVGIRDSCTDAFADCVKFTDQEALSFCEKSAASCVEQVLSGRDRYSLPRPRGEEDPISGANFRKCFVMAVRLARAYWPGSYPVNRMPQPSPPQSEEEAKPPAQKEETRDTPVAPKISSQSYEPKVFTPDNNTRFVIYFAGANFSPLVNIVSGPQDFSLVSYNSQDFSAFIPLGDGYIGAIYFGIKYKIEKIENKSYRMTYRIFTETTNGTPLGDEQVVDIKASDGRHIDDNLAFGITLSRANDPTRISSIRIVKVKE